ncbi:MAG: hypothetical protein EXR08_00980 [Alphaproteobacteria bacterium]|nr:hypothetical protein [Alphaproteobacteria bacterium]
MNFVNLKIRSKLLFLVAVLSAVTIAVAATGMYFISDMNNATSEVGLTSSEALLGEGLNQIVVTLNRANTWRLLTRLRPPSRQLKRKWKKINLIWKSDWPSLSPKGTKNNWNF